MKGAAWIKELAVQAAWAAIRTKDTYLHAQFLRLRARRGGKKAIVAVAASILTIVYYIIREERPTETSAPITSLLVIGHAPLVVSWLGCTNSATTSPSLGQWLSFFPVAPSTT
jgi:hypothetical protein